VPARQQGDAGYAASPSGSLQSTGPGAPPSTSAPSVFGKGLTSLAAYMSKGQQTLMSHIMPPGSQQVPGTQQALPSARSGNAPESQNPQQRRHTTSFSTLVPTALTGMLGGASTPRAVPGAVHSQGQGYTVASHGRSPTVSGAPWRPESAALSPTGGLGAVNTPKRTVWSSSRGSSSTQFLVTAEPGPPSNGGETSATAGMSAPRDDGNPAGAPSNITTQDHGPASSPQQQELQTAGGSGRAAVSQPAVLSPTGKPPVHPQSSPVVPGRSAQATNTVAIPSMPGAASPSPQQGDGEGPVWSPRTGITSPFTVQSSAPVAIPG
jgi:hypothetical protein